MEEKFVDDIVPSISLVTKARYTLPVSTGRVYGLVHGP